MKRRRLTLADKVKILSRQASCGICGGVFRVGDRIEYDHIVALGIGGSDDILNMHAVHEQPCHANKTHGPSTKSHGRGTDTTEAARVKRISRGTEEFRSRLLAKGTDSYVKPKGKIQSRGFSKKKDGQVSKERVSNKRAYR